MTVENENPERLSGSGTRQEGGWPFGIAGPVVLGLALLGSCTADSSDPESGSDSWYELFRIADSVEVSDSISSLLTMPGGGTWIGDGWSGSGHGPAGAAESGSVSHRPSGLNRLLGRVDLRYSVEAHLAAGSLTLPSSTHTRNVPYWASFRQTIAAFGADRTIAAHVLRYPVYVFGAGGVLIDSLGTPPASWRRARRPERGEFPPSRGDAWRQYLKSFTVINALAAIADSVVVVVHGAWDAEAGRFTDGSADVYVGKRVVAREIEVEGDVVAYSPKSVLVLKSAAGNGEERTLIEYEWRGPTE